MQNHKQIIDSAMEGLRASHQRQILMPLKKRYALLKALYQGLCDNESRILQALKDDLGKSPFESYVAEIALVKEEIKTAERFLSQWCAVRPVSTPLVFQPGTSFVKPTPKGVVLIIAPWNYPFQLSLVPLVSALAAGNCVVLKPSEHALHSEKLIKEIIEKYLDRDCVSVLCGDRELAQALVETPFDHIFYTGSTQVGREVMKKAAHNLVPVTLELGGKSPAIVAEDADIDRAAQRIMWAKCLNAGQTCIAPDYVLLHERQIEPFVMSAKKYLRAMYGDDPRLSEDYGRIINRHHTERLKNYLFDGRIVCGGTIDLDERYVEPTIMVEVKPDATVMKEEIFGPILPLISVKNTDEAISFVTAREHPLALYIFSHNKKTIKKICDGTLSGGVVINDCITHVAISDLPFGGIRHSGMGNYHGRYGFETFSHLRAFHQKGRFFDNPIKYPPYSSVKLSLARLAM